MLKKALGIAFLTVLLCSAFMKEMQTADQRFFPSALADEADFVISAEGVLTGYTGTDEVITIPDTVVRIGQQAFENCTSLVNVTIPEGVTHIGDSAFSGCTGLQEITLPQSLLAIDGWAFSGCEGLVSFTLPDGVETIGNAILNGSDAVVYCHYDSSAARAISRISHDFYIPGDDRFLLRYITEGEQTKLTLISYTGDETDVVVPSYIQELDYSVFAENTTIETVVLPSGITKISYGVFKNCAALTSVTLPDTVTDITQSAFDGCSHLAQINIPEGVTHIGDSAFSGCTSLQEITLPQSLLAIDGWAFSGCEGLVSFTLPDGVETIGNAILNGSDAVVYCHYDSSAARAISRISHDFYIPGDDRFLLRYITEGEQTKLTLISYTGDETDVVVPSYIQELDYSVFAENTTIETVVLPSGITKISYGVFKNCAALTSVTLPDTVTDIAQGAFEGCSHLAQISIPEGVTHIGNSAFYGCTSLTEILLPASLRTIEGYAFGNCTGISGLTLPDNVSTVADSILSGTQAKIHCSIGSKAAEVISNAGKSFYLPGDDSFALRNYRKSFTDVTPAIALVRYTGQDSEVTIPDYVDVLLDESFLNNRTVSKVTIPEGFDTIPNNMFNGCWHLQEVSIPSTVNKILNQSFKDCTALTAVVLPDGLKSMGFGVFNGCSNLQSLVLPEGLLSIGANTFVRCYALENLTIPDSVTSIGEGALSGPAQFFCNYDSVAARLVSQQGLSFCVPGAPEFRLRYTTVNGITKLALIEWMSGENPSITVPQYVERLADNAFHSGILEVTLPESIEYISRGVFLQCRSLVSLLIPQSVKTIEPEAFSNCGNLRLLVYENSYGETYAVNNGIPYDYVIPQSGTIEIHLAATGDIEDYEGCKLVLLANEEQAAAVTLTGSRSTYGFSGVRQDVPYVVQLVTPYGDTLVSFGEVFAAAQGEVHSLEIPTALSFAKVTLTDHDGKDVTEKASVTWYDGETMLSSGSEIDMQPVGKSLIARVTLNSALGVLYAEPLEVPVVVSAESSETEVTLVSLTHRTVAGTVVDADTGAPVAGAVLAASQSANGRYPYFAHAQTGADGSYELDLIEGLVDVTVRKNGYSDYCTDLADTRIALQPLSAPGVSLEVRYLAVGENGPEESPVSPDGLVVSAVDLSTGSEVQTVLQYPSVLFPGSRAGDRLRLRVSNRNDVFALGSADFVLEDSKDQRLSLTVYQHGGIHAAFVDDRNAETLLMLYDSDEKLVMSRRATADETTFRPVAAGTYTLVMMGYHPRISSVPSLGMLDALGLAENRDYICESVNVAPAVIGELVVENTVPKLDSEMFSFLKTGTVTRSRASMIAGEYVTVTASASLKEEYADAQNLTWLILVPEGCHYVAGSAVIDKTPVILPENAGEMLEIPVSDLSGKLRFCLSPIKVGDYSANVMLRFDHNGETVIEPVGAAQYQAKGLTVIAPATAGPESITIRGTASAKAKISIYDVNRLIGQTQAKANGEWSTAVILDDGNVSAFHVIRVEAQDSRDEDIVVSSGSNLIRYSPGTIQLCTITMVNTAHPAENLNPQEYQTVFDYGQLSRSKIYYRYWPAYPEFTFILKFTDNSPEKLSDVQVLVKLSDNSTEQLDAVYSKREDAWFAVSRYENSGALPVQVGVSFKAEKEVVFEAAEMNPETFDAEDVAFETTEIVNPDGKEAEIRVTDDDGTVLLTRRISLSEVTEDRWKEMLTVRAYTKAESTGGFELYQYNAYTDRSIVKESVFVKDGYAVICRDTVDSDLLEFVHDVFSLVDMDECEAMYQELQRIKLLERPILVSAGGRGAAGLLSRGTSTENADDPLISRTAVAHYDNFRKKFDNFENKWHGKDAIDLYSEIKDLIEKIHKYGGKTAPYLPDISTGYDTIKDFTLALALLEDIIDCKGISATSAVKMKLYVQAAPLLTIASRIAWQTAGSVGDTLDTVFEGLEGIWEKAVEILSDFKTHVPGYDNFVTPGTYDQSVFEDWRQGWLKDANDYIDDASRWPMLFFDVIEDTLREKCKRPKPDSEEGDPIQDPSGVVYEAVPGNLLSGVKVTCIEKVTEYDPYGDPVIYEREWDAEEYGQLNPQITDESGSYCWDVPEGLWRVRYEKKGYETVYSDWMTVPPPRFEINVGLVSYVAPAVTGIRAFTDGVEISFSKYMKTETVTGDTVRITFEGAELTGVPEWLDAAEDPGNPGKMLGTKVLFRTENAIPKGEVVSVSVSTGVLSYAGVSMQSGFAGTAETASRIGGITVDDALALSYGETKTVTIAAFPAEAATGHEVRIMPVSETMVSVSEKTIALNAEGQASVDVTGLMAGSTLIRFTLAGNEIESSMKVTVAMPEKEQAAAPEASVPADSAVPYASEIALTTDTDGAEIYYRIDTEGDVSEEMLLYTEPIVLRGDATLFAVAVKNGMYDSDMAVFSYRIADVPIVEKTVSYVWTDWCGVHTGKWDENLETQLGTELDWVSDDENVAQIKDGKITIRGAGEAAVHATDGIYEVARFDVVVNDVGPGLVLPGEMKTVGNEAFKGSNHIQAVRISSKTYEIGDSAFEGCENMKIILIPDSVRIIGDGAFNACAKDFSIVGVAGSPAAHYAEKTGIPFFAIP